MTSVSNGGTTTLGLYDTQSQLKEKADITYVDNKVDPLQAGHKGYATLALAQAAQSGLAANTVVEVLSDTTEANNGYYLWNGTTLTKSAYDPLTQAKQSAASLSAIGRWLTEDGKKEIASLGEASIKYLIAKAVKKITVTNPTIGKQYKLGTVLKNWSPTGSRISIADDTGIVSEITIPLATVVSGVQEYSLSGLKNGKVLIDWDVLSNGTAQTLLNMNINNDVYLSDYNTQVAASAAQTTANSAINFAAINKPDWLLLDNTLSAASDAEKKVAYAIKGMEIYGNHAYDYFRITVFAKNDAMYGNRVFIASSTGTTVLNFNESAQLRKGIQTHTLSSSNSSGLTGKITIDWDALTSGLLLNNANSALKINPTCKDLAYARELADLNQLAISQLSATSPQKTLATKPYRVAIAGSSITWGQGYLGQQSYVGTLEQILRNQYATTLHAKDLASSATTLTGENWYLGQAKRISGVNAQVEFQMTGDELSLSIGRERSNAGAANIQLYVDNVLYDTFNTLNNEPKGSATKNFTGNGTNVKFDLGECFTYGHTITVDGVAKTGGLNIQGAGGSIPVNDDFMVVRQYNSTLNKVTHVVWFKTAPTGAIVVNYNYGENISHMKGTLGHNGAGFTSTLESAYGDGSVAFDTTLPSSVSSGLGFRQSDERSVVTYKFDESKARTFKFVIASLATGATGATPYLDLNFVTNRMHHIMNAGIGGWTAAKLLSDSVKINTINEVINFNPDVLLIESCTNDDWSTFAAKATVARSGLTNAQILSEPTSNYFSTITGTSDNKSVTDTRLPIIAITENTVQLGSGITDGGIAAGDIITIGSYGGSHKRVAVRVIKSYDAATRTVTLNRSISVKDFIQCNTLNDLLSEHAIITNAPTWTTNVKALCDAVWSSLPECKVHITTSGIPNYYQRRLFGYRELGQKIAKEYNVGFVDLYNASRLYQLTQLMTTHQTITSTGATSYALNADGYLLANPIVLVDGVQHTKCRIVGGLSMHWAAGVTDPTLSNTTAFTRPYRLIFDADVPANGANIVVQKSVKRWANDYCHPTAPQGLFVFGQSAAKILKDVN